MIGKTLFRERTECGCETCIENYTRGVYVDDEEQAAHLFAIESELGYRYFETKKERDEYVRTKEN